jgi:hypothetical protein
MKFEDTKLLRHPLVEKAYAVMRTFFKDGDDWAREAVKAGEVISTTAKTPDPVAVAASVLLNGMVIPLDPKQFEKSVSPEVARCLERLDAIDIDSPKFSTVAEQQVLLAQSIIGLDMAQAEIASGSIRHIIEFRNLQQVLDANERALKSIAASATEKDMLAAAETKLAAAQTALADIVTARHKEIAFEASGLPDHPTIKKVYNEMKTWALDGDPLGGYTLTNAGIARVLVETGASSDPEVISAALLNQYSLIKPGHKKPADFSPRIGELWEQTSPWADIASKKPHDTTPQTPDALAITHAALTHFLEGQLKGYIDYRKDKSFDPATAEDALEQLEKLKDKVAKAAALEGHEGLRTRMEKAVLITAAVMHAPENTSIRKPSGPKP